MDINHMQRTSPYSYYVDADRIKQRLCQEADRSGMEDRQKSDSLVISEEGRNALLEKMSAFKRERLPENMGGLPSLSAGAYGIMNDFEEIIAQQEGERTDTFDSHVNKMAYAYQMMKDRIEEKYRAVDGRKEYYAAEDGSMQELTREKELEMLDQAYESHSRFMAANTQIWSELQDFRARINHHTDGPQTQETAMKKQHKEVKEQAYNAFMSAVSEENTGLLKQAKGDRKYLRLNLNISSSTRNMLNGIWDYMRG